MAAATAAAEGTGAASAVPESTAPVSAAPVSAAERQDTAAHPARGGQLSPLADQNVSAADADTGAADTGAADTGAADTVHAPVRAQPGTQPRENGSGSGNGGFVVARASKAAPASKASSVSTAPPPAHSLPVSVSASKAPPAPVIKATPACQRDSASKQPAPSKKPAPNKSKPATTPRARSFAYASVGTQTDPNPARASPAALAAACERVAMVAMLRKRWMRV